MDTLHASGLHRTPNDAVAAQLDLWADDGYRYLTHTEAAKHRAAFSSLPGFGVIHPFGTDGQAECAIQYRLDGPPLFRSKPIRLSALPIPRRNGDLCYAAYGEFDHHLIAVHMPSGVEGPGGLLDNAQATVYRDAIGGLRRFVATLDGRVRIAGDWNLNLRLPWVRKYFELHFPDFTPTAVPAGEPGTHDGGRVIDFSLVRGYTAVGDVVPNPTSDHRAISERHTKETAVTAPDPYARSTFHGKTLDNASIASLKQAEAKLGYELTIVQGIGGAQASAGTHLEGRAVDLAAWDQARKVRVLKDLGWAAWFRPERPGVWGAHIHAILIFESATNGRGVADSALRQIGSYLRGRDGLAGDNPDPSYRPDPRAVFTLAEYRATFAKPTTVAPTRTLVTRARDRIVEAMHNVDQAIALLKDTNPERVRARDAIDDLQRIRKSLQARLEALPPR